MSLARQLNGTAGGVHGSKANSISSIGEHEESKAIFILPSEFQNNAQQYTQSSTEARAWLLSFHDQRPGTDVSYRFRIEVNNYPSEPPFSLLPVLADWIKTWFERSLQDSRDRSNLTWLLQFTADYVDLGHARFDPEEVSNLCSESLKVCHNARHHSHLEGCLSIFLAVAKVRRFPEECLKDVLDILSSAVIKLERPLSRIPACIQLLASGSLAQQTVDTLYQQLLAVPEITQAKEAQQHLDVSKYLTPARGSARNLATLLETSSQDEKFVLDIDRLLNVLKTTAGTHLLRLATEILDVLARTLQSQRLVDFIDAQQRISAVFTIYELCRAATIVPEPSNTNVSKEDNLKRERRYRRDHIHSLEVLQGELAKILPLMNSENSEKAWANLKHELDTLSAQARASVIDRVCEEQICMPGKPGWEEELMFLLRMVVIDGTTKTDQELETRANQNGSRERFVDEQVQERIKQRIRILHLCAQAIHNATKPSTTTGTRSDDLDTGHEALRALLSIFGSEHNSHVIRAFLDETIRLADTTREDGTQPYAQTIVESLSSKVLRFAPSDNTADGTFLAGVEALRDIFLQGLNSPTTISKQAYDALLAIADFKANKCRSARCRLAAMSLLFRIRCDTSMRVYIDTSSSSAHLATALCKTDESLGAMFTESVEAQKHQTSAKLEKVISRQLWMYPREQQYLESWSVVSNVTVSVRAPGSTLSDRDLDISKWLLLLIEHLQEDTCWETYSYMIVHLGNQLLNTKLFGDWHTHIANLRGHICGQVRGLSKMLEPPSDIGLDKADVALCLYDILTRMIPYYKMLPPNAPRDDEYDKRRRGLDLIRAFREGIGPRYQGTARACIHALVVCCYEMPDALASEYPGVIGEMARSISQPHLRVHILEFLAQIARMPEEHDHFREEEIKQIFFTCTQALEHIRNQARPKLHPEYDSKRSSTPVRWGAGVKTLYRAAMLKEIGLPQYTCALSYHTIIFWFLAIPIGRRQIYAEDIIKRLTFGDSTGQEHMEQQSIVLIDLMQRTAFSELAETKRDETFDGDDYICSSYIDGYSVITVQTHKRTGVTQITKRQAAGTTNAIYNPLIQQQLPPHHAPRKDNASDLVLPSHTFLNMVGTAIPIPIEAQPLKLNLSEPYVGRALRMIDGMSALDSHKIGLILLKDGQIDQKEYLANTTGTPSFEALLTSIGTKVSLESPTPFAAHGLLKDVDGKETIAWRDRINEIVFAIPTLMPNVDGDNQQARKMSHLGNCNVVIIFNQSNKRWQWDYLKTQASMVMILITPANCVSGEVQSDDYEHEYFQVEVLTKEEYQNISAAADTKVVSRENLAPFVRLLALNANIFSACAKNDQTKDDEFPSSWRYRLQQIIQLKERTQQRTLDNEDTLARRYDFSRWT